MERNKVALERERQQQQQQEREQCNAEQAVSKHFEESLRRANEKQMRAAWKINAIPASQSHSNQQQQQQQQNQNHYATTQSPISTQGLPPKMPDELLVNDLAGKRGLWPQPIYFNRKSNSPSHHQLLMPNVQITRTQTPEYISSQAHHELATASQHPTSQSIKNLDKVHLIKSDRVSPNSLPIFGYNYGNSSQYQKDAKTSKTEIIHSNVPSIINQQSTGVIVKHDTSLKPNPIIAHRAVDKFQTPMIVQHQSPVLHQQPNTHSIQSYEKMPSIPVPSMPSYSPSYQPHQTIQLQLPPSTSAFQSNQPTMPVSQYIASNEQVHQQNAGTFPPRVTERGRTLTDQQAIALINAQSKPKVSSPAPSKIYGRPGSLSTDQSKINLIGSIDRTISEPPPAHSHSQKCVLPYQPLRQSPNNHHSHLSNPSPSSPSIAPISLTCSPGVHHPSQLSSINSSSSMYIQSKPLDLGVFDRCSNNKTISTADPIALDTRSLSSQSPRVQHEQSPPILVPDRKEKQIDLSRSISASSSSSSSSTISKEIILMHQHQQQQPHNQSTVFCLTSSTSSTDSYVKPKTITTSCISVAPTKTLFINDHDIESLSLTISPKSNFGVLTHSDKSNTSIRISHEPTENGIETKMNESSDKIPIETSKIQLNATNVQTNSANGLLRASPTPSPNLNDKPSSPAAPRHLKKAWLQRHNTGEDYDNTTQLLNNVKNPLSQQSSTDQSTITTDGTMTLNDDKEDAFKTATALCNNGNSLAVNNYNRKPGVRSQPPKKSIITVSHLVLNQDNSDKMNDSSSSDDSSPLKSLAKRKPPKGKRRKAGYRRITEGKKDKGQSLGAVLGSNSDKESGESNKDSMSDKEAMNGNGNDSASSKDKEPPKKRIRQPKEEPDAKKRKITHHPKEFKRPSILHLKKTGESFLQGGSCFEVAPKLGKCRECRLIANQRSKIKGNIFCRFYAFRKLKYTKTGQVAVAGFSDPINDSSKDDLKIWNLESDNSSKDLDVMQARYLLCKVADLFCNLYNQEKKAEEMNGDKKIAWKRVVQDIREMCDVCETTLFNYHWACTRCGFCVCIDCYKARKDCEKKIWNNDGVNDRDEFFWYFCNNRMSHDPERLMLTQITAGDSLNKLGLRVHTDRKLWDIEQHCDCPLSKLDPPKATNGMCKDFVKAILNDNKSNGYDNLDFSSSDSEVTIKKETESSLAIKNENQKSSANTNNAENNKIIRTNNDNTSDDNSDSTSDDDDDDDNNQQSTLRGLLIGSTNKSSPNSPANSNVKRSDTDTEIHIKAKIPKKPHKEIFKEMMAELLQPAKQKTIEEEYNFGKSGNMTRRDRCYVPTRVMTLALSKEYYPNVNHMWYCDGRLLRLLEPNEPNNLKIFQQQWKRGQPVLISNVHKQLKSELWRPESFSHDFGDMANDLVNCLTGALVPNQPMKRFWDGFDYINKRIKDLKGEPMLLKLKDWPSGEDFAEQLPTRYADLMKSLPLGDYTKRTGKFNLAGRLPDSFSKPDLGPKMYNAYGSAKHPTKGTTNLHLDISDAVNVMVYVGIPKDTGDDNSHLEAAYRAVEESGCDTLQLQRIKEKDQYPGALWHIYAPRDANKIRDLLNRVAIEDGVKLERNHDAIHDQSWYLNKELRDRLYREYNVEGYAIAQCLGDSVFIPAGAPHQVQNLLNCIKVAEDFVSPENVFECFHLTNEFRTLTETHSNHEDKLQIKNIIYHTIKDALGVLSGELDVRINNSIIKTEAKEEMETEDDDGHMHDESKNESNAIAKTESDSFKEEQ